MHRPMPGLLGLSWSACLQGILLCMDPQQQKSSPLRFNRRFTEDKSALPIMSTHYWSLAMPYYKAFGGKKKNTWRQSEMRSCPLSFRVTSIATVFWTALCQNKCWQCFCSPVQTSHYIIYIYFFRFSLSFLNMLCWKVLFVRRADFWVSAPAVWNETQKYQLFSKIETFKVWLGLGTWTTLQS